MPRGDYYSTCNASFQNNVWMLLKAYAELMSLHRWELFLGFKILVAKMEHDIWYFQQSGSGGHTSGTLLASTRSITGKKKVNAFN